MILFNFSLSVVSVVVGYVREKSKKATLVQNQYRVRNAYLSIYKQGDAIDEENEEEESEESSTGSSSTDSSSGSTESSGDGVEGAVKGDGKVVVQDENGGGDEAEGTGEGGVEAGSGGGGEGEGKAGEDMASGEEQNLNNQSTEERTRRNRSIHWRKSSALVGVCHQP